MDLKQGGWRIGLVLAAALALHAAALALMSPASLQAAWAGVGALGVAGGVAVCLAGIAVRFLRWQWLLRVLGVALPAAASGRVYLAGIAMSWTPGKLGETLRSALLLPRGVAVGDSLAAFLADRMSDVIGVAALGLAAVALASGSATLFAGVMGLGLALSLAAAWGLRRLGVPVRLRRWATPLTRWAAIWTPLRASVCAAAGLLAYGLQALVFAGFASALLPDLNWALCVAAFAAAIFVGAASLIPAGLGAMEATLAYALTRQGLGWGDAVAVTLLFRLCSLWIPTVIGVVALLGLIRHPHPSTLAAAA